VINAIEIRSYDTLWSQDTLKHEGYDIQLSIVNKSDKPIYFWLMTCSWEDNFIINNDYMEYVGGACTRNFPKIMHIKQNDSIVAKTSIVRWQYHTFGQLLNNTRFGFIYIDTNKCKNDDGYMEIMWDKSKQDNIIWSNPLYLSKKK